jgi:hypothetical protein
MMALSEIFEVLAWGMANALPVDCNGLLLRDEPPLHTRSTIKHRAADVRPRRSHLQDRPPVERARIPLQLLGQFFLG